MINYFVTETIIKNLTVVPKNLDINVLMTNVPTYSNMRVRRIMGTHFYKYLLNKYNTTPGAFTAMELELLDILQQAISWGATHEVIVSSSWLLTNKGLQKQGGDNSNASDFKEINYVAGSYKQNAEYWLDDLFDFLILNKNEFPEFILKLNNDSTAKNSCDGGGSGFIDKVFFI
jgi:hypothetical protein